MLNSAIGPVAVLPPDAPESNPAKAALPVEKEPPAGVLTPKEAGKLKKPDLVQQYEICFGALMDKTAVPTEKPQQVDIPLQELAEHAIAVVSVTSSPTIYVNCVPSEATNRLEPYIFGTLTQLNTAAGCDIRMSDKKTLAYGAWKGALATAVKENPPQGSYTVTLKGDDVAEIVVSALEGTHKFVRGF